jgi:hypothetical protein
MTQQIPPLGAKWGLFFFDLIRIPSVGVGHLAAIFYPDKGYTTDPLHTKIKEDPPRSAKAHEDSRKGKNHEEMLKHPCPSK